MLSNIKVAKILQEYAKEVNQNFLLYKISEQNEITIYTHIPGILIGKAGSVVEKYRKMLNELVTKENSTIREINDRRVMEFNSIHKDTPYEERPKLFLLSYEHSAEIVFIECCNSKFDALYDPMSECM